MATDILCKKRVFAGRLLASHRCMLKAVKDGLCKKHQPEAVKAHEEKMEVKNAAKRAALNKEWDEREERNRRADLFDELVAALEEFMRAVNSHGQWDDGCFYYNTQSASELQRPIDLAEAVLKKAKAHQ